MIPPAPEPDAAQKSARDDVLVVPNELLEAERTGARVALETGREIPPSALAVLEARDENIKRVETRSTGRHA